MPVGKKPPGRNPLRVDPTRTAGMVRAFSARVKVRFRMLERDVTELIRAGDAAGLTAPNPDPHAVYGPAPKISATTNAENPETWRGSTAADKVRLFGLWLKKRFHMYLSSQEVRRAWEKYVREGYERGAGRAFDDATRTEKQRAELLDDGKRYLGTRDEFLRSSFGQPVAVERVQALVERSFQELDGMTADLSNRMVRSLADSLTQGKHPREAAKDLQKQVGIGRERALLIARTEIIRAHADGQLDSLTNLGVKELSVDVEFSNTGDGKVCPKCAALGNRVYRIEDARGIIPVHPRCRCSWVPKLPDSLLPPSMKRNPRPGSRFGKMTRKKVA
ncbi:MAG: minor capsid protein [Fimbriiglobus sp.]